MENAPLAFQTSLTSGSLRRNFGGLTTIGHSSGTPPVVIMSPTMCTTTPVSMDTGSQDHWCGANQVTSPAMTSAKIQLLIQPYLGKSFSAFAAMLIRNM